MCLEPYSEDVDRLDERRDIEPFVGFETSCLQCGRRSPTTPYVSLTEMVAELGVSPTIANHARWHTISCLWDTEEKP